MSRFTKDCRRGGVTLTELLVVVGLIAVLATFVGISLGGREGVGLSSGQRIAASMFRSAKSVAVMRQTEARVIIYADDEDDKKRLRFMGIVYHADTNDDGTPDDWLPANNGIYLPEGIYYLPASGDQPAYLLEDSQVGGTFRRSDSVGSGTYNFPAESGPGETFFEYEFNPNGTTQNSGDSVVLAAGELQSSAGGTGTDIVLTNPFQVSGFILRKLGNVTLFTDYDDIP